VACAALFGWLLFAQSFTGTIEGTVQDPTGGAIANTKVTATNVGTGQVRVFETNDAGRFVIPNLPSGLYKVSAEHPSFKKALIEQIKIEVQQTVSLILAMEVGSVTQTVEVSAVSPLLQATTSSLGQVIESRQLADLPLNNRTSLGLLTLSDNVVIGRGFDPALYNGANLFSANGSRPGQNEILLDGAPNTVPGVWPGRGIMGVALPVEAVQEFKVQTNGFSAEFGRSGGGLINMVTKTGTNELHGALFEYLRNSKLDANSFFNNRSGLARGSFKRNQMGGTVGGPVVIPKLYDGRNRTFFFTTYQATRARTADSRVVTVPTTAMRGGDFSALTDSRGTPIIIYDPQTLATVAGEPTRQVFPGARIPAARISPVAAKVSTYWNAPNLSGSINNLALSDAIRRTVDDLAVRIDHNISSAHRVNGRVNYTRDNTLNPPYFGLAVRNRQGLNQDVYSASGEYSANFGPTTLFSTRYVYTRTPFAGTIPSLGIDLTTLGFPAATNSVNQERVFPSFSAGGYAALGNNEGINDPDYATHAMQASMTRILTRHTWKFGADYRISRVTQDRGIDMSGTYNFDRGFTQGPNAVRGGAAAGDGYASMLLGIPSSGAFGAFIRSHSLNPYYGFYAQDDWKVSQRFTLNIGLRYELEMPRTEREDRLDWFDYNAVNPLSQKVTGLGQIHGALQFAGVNGNTRRHFDTDGNNFAPRFGFAFQADRFTVIRGGYGIFFGSGSVGAGGWNIASQEFAPSTPYVGSLDGIQPIATLSNPFPGGFNKPAGSSDGLLSQVGQNIDRVYDRMAPLPYNQQWSFSIQRQVGQMLVQTAYSGSRGIHLGDGAGFNLNQLQPETLKLGNALQQLVPNPFFGIVTSPGVLSAAQVARGQLLRPYPQFGNLTVFNPAASASTYHGFSAKIERRFASGLGFLASYTFSKNISDAPATIGPSAGHQDAFNRRADRSVVEEDIPHRFIASAVWELPIGRTKKLGLGWNRAVDSVLGGWQVNAIFTRQSGAPLVLNNNPNTTRALGGTQRPNSKGFSAVKEGSVQSRFNEYLSPAAFSAPDPFTYGNVARTLGDVRGPRYSNLDLSLFKNFQVNERVRMQVRAEWFNSTNTPIFGLPNTGFGSAAFGTISNQQNDPRQVQLALRLHF
jgi:hypothetical protein